MARRVVSNEATVDAPQAVVWELIADGEGWKRWAGFTAATLEREGSPERDGVGAVRKFGVGKILSREEVTEFEAPHRLSYRLLSGLPITDYHSTVTITEIDDRRCRVGWASSFEDTGVMSFVMKGFIAVVLRNMLKRLSSYASGSRS
ncbi:MAG: SRPBCC family protein [Actinobacteria bacterium]|nr:SRPBCC family protein [Actinomycetota bacterium]